MAFEIIGYGGLVPGGVSMAVAYACRRGLPREAADRWAAAAAVALGFAAGYCLMPWTSLAPERHWNWLPYLGLLAAVLGGVGSATGVYRLERGLLRLVLAIIASWLLVPVWPSLEPPRPACMALLAAYLWLLMTGLEALPERLSGRLYLGLWAIVAAGVAVLLAATVSLKFGQLAGMASAALAGCWAASWFRDGQSASRSLASVAVVLVAGVAFVGCIEPEPPQPGLLLAAAAPLALWLFAAGPLARLSGATSVAVQAAAVLVPLLAATAWILIGGKPAGDVY